MPSYDLVSSYAAGLLLGLSLIIAIGAQNVFVLRQGLKRERVGLVVVICAVSDAVLIAAGIAGLGAVVGAHPGLVTGARWCGAVFLLGYGVLAARRAWRGAGAGLAEADGEAHADPAASSLWSVAAAALAFTWLNPHVYLDTVFLLGSIASTHAAPWVFGAGAITGSVLWFTALGYGARGLAPLLSTPRAWRVLDGIIAGVMLALAVMLVVGA